MLTVTPSVDRKANLFDRKERGYKSSGYSSDTLTTIIVDFGTSTGIDIIALQNNNLADLIIWDHMFGYVFSLTSNCPTSVSYWNSNTVSNLFLELTQPQTWTTIYIECGITSPKWDEKKLGELWFLENLYSFDKLPDYTKYRPTLKTNNVIHKMSDGGVIQYKKDSTFKSTIQLDYVSDSCVESLREIYDMRDSFVFIPFPTGTGWNGEIYEVNWTNKFDFMRLNNSFQTGNNWKGTIHFTEVTK